MVSGAFAGNSLSVPVLRRFPNPPELWYYSLRAYIYT